MAAHSGRQLELSSYSWAGQHRSAIAAFEGVLRLHRRFQSLESISTFALETLFGRLPIEDPPDVLDILRFTIKVLKIVSMLPHVHPKEGSYAGFDRILIFRCRNAEPTGIIMLYKPPPSGALDTEQGLAESLLKACVCACTNVSEHASVGIQLVWHIPQ